MVGQFSRTARHSNEIENRKDRKYISNKINRYFIFSLVLIIFLLSLSGIFNIIILTNT